MSTRIGRAVWAMAGRVAAVGAKKKKGPLQLKLQWTFLRVAHLLSSKVAETRAVTEI